MPKKIIINADDFGFSTGVNAGIIECLESGLIRSATIMANTPGAEEAASYAKAHPEFDFGLHLNLVWGRPISEKPATLCAPDGSFLPPLRLLKSLITGAVDQIDLENEIRGQLAFCCDRGVRMTHADSHKHFHVFRPVYRALTKVAAEFGVRSFRLPREIPIARSRFFWKARLLRMLSRGLAHHLDRTNLMHPQYFYGSALMGASFTEDHLVRVLRQLPPSITELMVHVGRPEASFREMDPYVEWRGQEIDVLKSTSVREAMASAGIELSDFRALQAL